MSKLVSDTFGTSGSGDGLTLQYASSWSNAASPGVSTNVQLVAGNNTINIPAGTQFVTLVPSAGSTNGKTLKGTGADVGLALNPGVPHKWAPATGTPNFTITSIGSEVLQVLFT